MKKDWSNLDFDFDDEDKLPKVNLGDLFKNIKSKKWYKVIGEEEVPLLGICDVGGTKQYHLWEMSTEKVILVTPIWLWGHFVLMKGEGS